MWHVPMVTHMSIIVALRSLALEFIGGPYQGLGFKPPHLNIFVSLPYALF